MLRVTIRPGSGTSQRVQDVATVIRIQDIARYVGLEVELRGWVYAKTGKGKLHFIRLRDGSGQVQCVAFRDDLPEEQFEIAKGLTQESSVVITGIVKADERAQGFPAGYEIAVNGVQLVQQAVDYPITPKEHGTEFLMDHRHLWIRSNRQWAILRIRATIVKAMRDYMDTHDFLLMDTPIITPAAGEDSTSLFEIDYFGEPAFMAQTGQLYNEANMAAFGRVYAFGPTFRAEKSKTRRHLIEFWMLEPELAYCSLEELMTLEENLMTYIVQQVLTKNRQELEIVERDVTMLEKVLSPFPRISYDEAVDKLEALYAAETDPEQKELLKIVRGDDFGSPHETALTQLYDRPLFVYHYPTRVKAFYMQPVEGNPERCRSVDLLAPEGYGEICGGSERIYDEALLLQRLQDQKLPVENYQWYLELRRFGSVPHAGFGQGLERTVAWLCGLPHVRETIPYARLLNRSYP